ncbi:hypothetical protein LJC61_03810 [Ruminococcaceae bacterium OttesenSCG-928-A16]|nr:hypothetical protein [Ruminococcaceae bacterium OttesenSCG-928-A16]
MKAKRRVAVIATSLALAAIMLVGLTVAYLTDSRTATNVMGIGAGTDSEGNLKQSVMISLEEPSFVAHADEVTYLLANPDAEVTEASIENLLPGDNIYKDPTVTNSGADSVYLRVKIDMADAQLQKLVDDFGLEINDGFEKGTDGYYYYTGSTAGTLAEFTPGSVVEFFKTTGTGTDKYSMSIPSTWKNSDLETFLGSDSASFEMPIIAQAIQFRNFEPTGLAWTGVADADIQEVALANRR